jgi:hypothetical protein
MTTRPGRNSDKLLLRFPDGMKEALEAAAAENNRSLNAEIITRLEESFSGAPIEDSQIEVIKTVYQGMVSGMADHLIQQGLDVSKAEIEAFVMSRNRDLMKAIAKQAE